MTLTPKKMATPAEVERQLKEIEFKFDSLLLPQMAKLANSRESMPMLVENEIKKHFSQQDNTRSEFKMTEKQMLQANESIKQSSLTERRFMMRWIGSGTRQCISTT